MGSNHKSRLSKIETERGDSGLYRPQFNIKIQNSEKRNQNFFENSHDLRSYFNKSSYKNVGRYNEKYTGLN